VGVHEDISRPYGTRFRFSAVYPALNALGYYRDAPPGLGNPECVSLKFRDDENL
jgi:hypothetical protein